MNSNVGCSTSSHWEDSKQGGQVPTRRKESLSSSPVSELVHSHDWIRKFDSGAASIDSTRVLQSQHRTRPSEKLSDELQLQTHATRDSLVINLLSSFDRLPGGQATSYQEQSHLQPDFTDLYLVGDIPIDRSGESQHFRDFSDAAAAPPNFTYENHHDQRLDWQSHARSGVSSPGIRPSIDRIVDARMESQSHSRTNGSSRPGTAKSMDKRKTRGKGSKGSRGDLEKTGNADVTSERRSREDATDTRTSGSFDIGTGDKTRRRSRTNPSGMSILNRARPIPAEYHDFNSRFMSTNRDRDQRHQASRPPLPKIPSEPVVVTGDEKLASISRSKNMEGSGVRTPVIGTQEGQSPLVNSSGRPSSQMPSRIMSVSNTPSPSSTKNIPVEAKKEKQGFFRRVFGGSTKSQLPSQAEQLRYQLPPIHTSQNQDSKRSQTAPTSNIEAADNHHTNGRPQNSPQIHTAPPEIPTEQPHVIVKKASFFRRKKRSTSVSHDANDANDANDGTELNADAQPATSTSNRTTLESVSSLREIMNPFLSETQVIASPVESTYYDSKEHQSNDGDGPKSRQSVSPRVVKSPLESTDHVFKSSLTSRHVSDSASVSKTTERNGSVDPDTNISTLRKQSVMSDTFDASAQSQISAVESEISSPPEMEQEMPTPKPNTYEMPSISQARKGIGALDGTDAGDELSYSANGRSTVRLILSDDSEEDFVLRKPSNQSGVSDSPRTKRIWLHPGTSEENPAKGSRITSVSSVSIPEVIASCSPPTSPLETNTTSRSASVAADSAFEVSTHSADDMLRAKQLFEGNDDASNQVKPSTLLGQSGFSGDKFRQAYMSFYDFSGLNILLALRDLCGRLALKGETQQVDRILSAFSQRWIECNPNHGFKHQDVVHTMCYSIFLLNTDLHIADLDQKMTRSQFIRNTLETIRQASNEKPVQMSSTLRAEHSNHTGSTPWREARSPSPASAGGASNDLRRPEGRLSLRPRPRPTSESPSVASPSPSEARVTESADLLVNAPFEGTGRGWEAHVETVLREFYYSIRQQRLPLHIASDTQLHETSTTNLTVGSALGRRPSVLSKAPSEGTRRGSDLHSWNPRNRSKQRLYNSSSTHDSSRTSLDDGSIFSPNASSTWSRSFGKAPTSMSTDSLASRFSHADYGFQQSIGFANALSHAIIREEDGTTTPEDDDTNEALLDDESLGLEGPPWAKEGIVQHKHHMETADRRAKDRTWNQCFAVVEKGCLRLFSFNSKASIRSQKNRSLKDGAVVGGGNWMSNAEAVGSFTLRQTLANTLPAPGYSKSRPHVFALVLPTGGVHLFHVGTKEIAREFVSTANYWAARLSKEPLVGGVSNVEYGWSENIINTAILPRPEDTRGDGSYPPSSSAAARKLHSPTPSTSSVSARPSLQGSIRGGSIEMPGRARLPGDRVALSEWMQPQQSLGMSLLKEKEQLVALRRYVNDVEDELRQHNELRAGLLLTYSPRHPNSTKAMANWERKSSYLLREIVKFRNYIDVLVSAQNERDRVYKERAERKAVVAGEAEQTVASPTIEEPTLVA